MQAPSYDFAVVTSAIHQGLSKLLPPFGVTAVEMVLVGVVFLLFFAVVGLLLVLAERKICGWIQNRLGPNRVGYWGLMQTVADFIKLMMKELITPRLADRFLYNIAPFIVIISTIMALAIIPYSKGIEMMNFDIGVLYVIAVSAIGVLGILLAGWSSNNKYSLIGAMRSGAQIVSYELSVGMSLLTIVVFAGTTQLSGLVESQRDGWWIFKGHIPAIIAYVIFLIASTAEINRGPFDLAEAESELTGGFHTEYSGIKFAFFFLAEYMNMFLVACIGAVVFLGGWMPLHIGHWDLFNNLMDWIPPFAWFIGKVSFNIFVIMWFKWTFPRLRIDQLLTLEWKYFLPINLFNITLTAVLAFLGWYL